MSAFEVKIGITKSEKTALDKTVTSETTYSGTLINNSNVINPSILIRESADNIATKNYMTISKFGRKYFITEITALTADTCMVSGHVDVLSTYKSDIRKNNAIVGRSETNYNMYIDDDTIKTDARTVIKTLNRFNGGYFTAAGSIALVVVG